ncbi:MAG: hypothetical protein Q8Q49_00610 [bacterium]|nr:hypothetical protein [bacterium]
MITIIHGDNIAASRNTFIAEKNKVVSPTVLRGGEFTLTDLTQVLEGGMLFSESTHLFIEDLFGKVRKKDELEAYTSFFEKVRDKYSIFLWEGKTLTKQQLGLMKNATVELFRLPTSLFSFLDAISPKNTEQHVLRLAKAVADSGEEMVFTMLVRHIRLLLSLRAGADIDEVKRLASWQTGKLRAQASVFTTEQLLMLHSGLFTIDKERKTGAASLPLRASIDFLLLRLYHE